MLGAPVAELSQRGRRTDAAGEIRDARLGVDPRSLKLLVQHRQVEPLYVLEKAGKLGQAEQPVSDEARAFIEARLLEGGRMLGAIWLTAYRGAVPDTYLRAALLRRQTAAAPATPAKTTP